jgi:hypothetical protein
MTRKMIASNPLRVFTLYLVLFYATGEYFSLNNRSLGYFGGFAHCYESILWCIIAGKLCFILKAELTMSVNSSK